MDWIKAENDTKNKVICRDLILKSMKIKTKNICIIIKNRWGLLLEIEFRNVYPIKNRANNQIPVRPSDWYLVI